jgi:hypothetical protein
MNAEKVKNNTALADPGLDPPRRGDTFRCTECGMEVQVTSDCHCKEGEHVHFHCCGKELANT